VEDGWRWEIPDSSVRSQTLGDMLEWDIVEDPAE